MSRAPAPGNEWSSSSITRWNVAEPLFEARLKSQFVCTRRTPQLMNYYLQCPAAAWSAGLILRDGAPCGWYVLARVGGQSRIADLWIDSDAVADWTAGYALALRAASADPQACELVASASIPPAIEAAPRAGFRFRQAEPIYVLDPHKRFADAAPVNVTFLESDLAYISDPTYPYLT
jgi:hypothetical protein